MHIRWHTSHFSRSEVSDQVRSEVHLDLKRSAVLDIPLEHGQRFPIQQCVWLCQELTHGCMHRETEPFPQGAQEGLSVYI